MKYFVENGRLNRRGVTLVRIAISALIFALGIILEHTVTAPSEYVWLSLYLPAYFVIGYDVLWRALRNISRGRLFDENFLMTIATVGAFVIGEYPEALAVMLFYQVGELFQSVATDKSRSNIAELMDIRPDYAHKIIGDKVETVDPFDVQIGDLLQIKAGEKVPLDCEIVGGSSVINNFALTGESMPVNVGVGDELLSGSINEQGLLTVRATREFGESTASKIIDMVENASSNKSSREQFITKFARFYTPAVVLVALVLAIVPSIVTGEWQTWVYRALSFLVVSCPCALVISVPLSFFAGIGVASRRGVLVKGSNYLEGLARVDTVAMDKTGTITKGVFTVTEVVGVGVDRDELLRLTAYAESHSSHPIARSLCLAYGAEIDNSRIGEVTELSGHGVSALVDGVEVLVGNSALFLDRGIAISEVDRVGTVVHVSRGGEYIGYIVIADIPRENSRDAIDRLRRLGVKRIVMLTGDNRRVAEDIGDRVGVDEVRAELLPQDKVECIERLIDDKSSKGSVVFIGDGINDAPVLARADIGVAMGGVGSDSAIQASDIVVMNDDIDKVADAICLARKTLNRVRENIIFSLAVKLVVLVLAALGIASMWWAVFADVGVSIVAILNSMRLFAYKGKRESKKHESR